MMVNGKQRLGVITVKENSVSSSSESSSEGLYDDMPGLVETSTPMPMSDLVQGLGDDSVQQDTDVPDGTLPENKVHTDTMVQENKAQKDSTVQGNNVQEDSTPSANTSSTRWPWRYSEIETHFADQRKMCATCHAVFEQAYGSGEAG